MAKGTNKEPPITPGMSKGEENVITPSDLPKKTRKRKSKSASQPQKKVRYADPLEQVQQFQAQDVAHEDPVKTKTTPRHEIESPDSDQDGDFTFDSPVSEPGENEDWDQRAVRKFEAFMDYPIPTNM